MPVVLFFKFQGCFFFVDRVFSEAGRFLLFFFVYFLGIALVFSFASYEFFSLVFAYSSLFVLSFFGVFGEVYSEAPVLLSLSVFKEKVWLSYLCTGLLEFFVVFSSILAAGGKKASEKALGVFASILFIFVFNTLRIVGSILAIHWFGLEAGVFSHDIFFRVFLFLSIFVFYAFWLFNSEKLLAFGTGRFFGWSDAVGDKDLNQAKTKNPRRT